MLPGLHFPSQGQNLICSLTATTCLNSSATYASRTSFKEGGGSQILIDIISRLTLLVGKNLYSKYTVRQLQALKMSEMNKGEE